jgi:hypothetical protein
MQSSYDVQPLVEDVHPDVMAFLGAIDDLVDEYNATCDERPDRSGDDEIMQMVSGVYDQASNYYSEDLATAVSMLDMVTQRMMEHACRHSHLSDALERNDLLPKEDSLIEKPHDHNRDTDDEDEEDEIFGKKNGRSSKKKLHRKKWKNGLLTSLGCRYYSAKIKITAFVDCQRNLWFGCSVA